MKILIACEFSGIVRDAFAARGHDAWSCDLRGASGNHYRGDVFNIIDDAWDMVIAHPPCTYISNMSNCRINEPGRKQLREAGMEFFMRFTRLKANRVAIENPRGLPERMWRKPDQIIQPYQFGHTVSKATCLWLKNAPPLISTNVVPYERKWDGRRWRTWVDRVSGGSKSEIKRSVTFQGIADAMAEQWGNLDKLETFP